MEQSKEVIEYFKNKATEYDLVENQIYWKLSDELLWSIFSKKVLDKLPRGFKFIDAGGGTGRWTKKILDNYDATGIIYDISEEMLEQARNKFNTSNYENRIELVKGDLHELKIEDGIFDLAFNFHNVLGFVQNPSIVISELSRVTKKGGLVVSLVPNLYHNIFFNIFVKNFELVDEVVKTKRGAFTDNMPRMNMFTPDSVKGKYEENGLQIEILSGFPISIYPGMQETQIQGSSEHVLDILEDERIFKKIYSIEMQLSEENSDQASRGNQIFIVGRKK